MTLELEMIFGSLLLGYRVYDRQGSTYKTYVARITGANTNFILDRAFEPCWRSRNSRWTRYRCLIETEGIYEIVIKRYNLNGHFLFRERKWVVMADGHAYTYDGSDMNAQYVLYCAWLLRPLCV